MVSWRHPPSAHGHRIRCELNASSFQHSRLHQGYGVAGRYSSTPILLIAQRFITPSLQLRAADTGHYSASPADRDHLAIRLIILPEIVLLRFPVDDAEEKLP